MKSVIRSLFIALSILWCVASTHAAERERKPIVLQRASTLQSFEENGIRRQELVGNVWMTRDSLDVTCHKATYYPDSGLVLFHGNVEFRDPNRTLLADDVTYDENTGEIIATNGVKVIEDTIQVTSRRARYDEGLKQGHLFDDVKIKEMTRNLLLKGQYGFIDHERKYGRVTGDPVLTERDSTLKEIAEVKGDTVEYFGDERRVQVSGNVVATREGLVAMGKRLDYFAKDRNAVLIGEPEALKEQDEMRGDTMRLFFEGEKLSRVEVIGHAVATSPADSGFTEPRNRMEGKRMTMWITDSKLTSALIEGTATATYFVREKGKPQGLNTTSGDRLRVYFDKSKISRIRVEGGTEGVYTPERLVAKKN
jgi:lipopolysaccharide export system protein LptA